MLALIPSIFTIIRLSVLAAALLYLGQPAHAEKTLTIASPLGEKVISLDEDPEIAISYTPSGIKLTFVNLGISTVCIEDPSSSGFCRLQAYDGGIPSGPGGPSTPKDMDPPSVVAGDTQVALTWSAPADDGGDEITGYRIQIASGGTLNWATLVSDTGNTNTRYTATGLVNGESYRFRVAAINGFGLGTFSPASATVVPADSQSGDTYAQACNSVAANIQCEFFNQGDLQSTNLAYFDINNGKILSIPLLYFNKQKEIFILKRSDKKHKISYHLAPKHIKKGKKTLKNSNKDDKKTNKGKTNKGKKEKVKKKVKKEKVKKEKVKKEKVKKEK